MGGNHMITLSEIKAQCGHLAKRDDAEIVRILGAGRTKSKEFLIGIGTVLETLGMAKGFAFLAFLETEPTMKYVWRLVAASNLNIGSAMVASNLDQLALTGILSSEDANKLKALGREADIVSHQEVERLLQGKTWPI